MSEWVNAIRNHKVWLRLETLGPLLDAALAKEGSNAKDIDDLQRLKAILTFSGKRLAAIDPAIAITSPLDAIENAFSSVSKEVEDFVATHESIKLTNANGYASQAVAAVATLPPPTTPDEITSLGEAAASYRNTLARYLKESDQLVTDAWDEAAPYLEKVKDVTQKLHSIDNELAAVLEKIASIESDISDHNLSLTTVTASFESRLTDSLANLEVSFSQSEDARAERFEASQTEWGNLFETAQTERQAAHQTMVEDWQRQQNEALDERASNFAVLIDKYDNEIREKSAEFAASGQVAFTAYQESLTGLQDRYGDEAQLIIDQIQTHRANVEKLVGVIGNLGVTSGYLNTANEAKNVKFFWQGVAVISLVVLSAFAIYSSNGVTVTWESITAHIISYIPIVVLAAYAGNQADKLHTIEKRNRKLALEFEAIGPYLAPLPEDMQHKFRIEVGERSFGRHEDDLNKAASDKSPATAIDLATNLGNSTKAFEAVTSMVKTIKG